MSKSSILLPVVCNYGPQGAYTFITSDMPVFVHISVPLNATDKTKAVLDCFRKSELL